MKTNVIVEVSMINNNIRIYKVSAIIPIYNVSAYIEKCARSLFEQTLECMEIIFVNDCTTDDSVKIIEKFIDEYQLSLNNKNSCARVVNMSMNAGQAGARHKGMIEASGKYVIHCDGDDWVDSDLYEKMYNEAIRCDADVVFCDEISEYTNSSSFATVENLPSNGKNLVKNWYKDTIGMFCHNKLVRRSIYVDNEIYPWEGLNMWEDNGLMTRILYHSNTISQIRGSYYHYNRANVNAMTAGYGEKQVRQMIGIAHKLTEFFENKEDAPEFQNTVYAFQYLAKLNLVTDSFSRLKEYNRIFPESNRIIPLLDKNAFSAKGLLRFRMVKLHLAWLFVILFKIFKQIKK